MQDEHGKLKPFTEFWLKKKKKKTKGVHVATVQGEYTDDARRRLEIINYLK